MSLAIIKSGSGDAGINTCDQFGSTPMYVACGFEMKETCLKLANHNQLDVHAIDTEMKETLLIAAAYTGMKEICEILLKRGVDKTIKNIDGDTALDVAKKEG